MKVGDSVVLKSGGPVMTVTKVDGPLVECQWFLKGNKLERGSFPGEALAPPAPPGPRFVQARFSRG